MTARSKAKKQQDPGPLLVPRSQAVPVHEEIAGFSGSLKGAILHDGDLISPIDVEWSAEG